MNSRVQEFLERNEAEVAVAKHEEENRKRNEILMSAGLYDEEFTYYSKRPDSSGLWETVIKDGKWCYAKRVRKPIDVTDEEFAQIQKALEDREKWIKRKQAAVTEQKIEETLIEPMERPISISVSKGAKFLFVIAWILWIGGFIAAIVNANATVTGDFSWTLFLTSALTYFFEGGLVMCVAEGLDNLQAVRDAVTCFRGFTAKKK